MRRMVRRRTARPRMRISGRTARARAAAPTSMARPARPIRSRPRMWARRSTSSSRQATPAARRRRRVRRLGPSRSRPGASRDDWRPHEPAGRLGECGCSGYVVGDDWDVGDNPRPTVIVGGLCGSSCSSISGATGSSTIRRRRRMSVIRFGFYVTATNRSGSEHRE